MIASNIKLNKLNIYNLINYYMKWALISIYLSIYISTTIFADIFLCTNMFIALCHQYLLGKPTNNILCGNCCCGGGGPVFSQSWLAQGWPAGLVRDNAYIQYLLKDINHLKNIMPD